MQKYQRMVQVIHESAIKIQSLCRMYVHKKAYK